MDIIAAKFIGLNTIHYFFKEITLDAEANLLHILKLNPYSCNTICAHATVVNFSGNQKRPFLN